MISMMSYCRKMHTKHSKLVLTRHHFLWSIEFFILIVLMCKFKPFSYFVLMLFKMFIVKSFIYKKNVIKSKIRCVWCVCLHSILNAKVIEVKFINTWDHAFGSMEISGHFNFIRFLLVVSRLQTSHIGGGTLPLKRVARHMASVFT